MQYTIHAASAPVSRLRRSLSAGLLAAGAAVLALLACSPPRAEAQTALRARPGSGGAYQAWTQAPELSVRLDVSFKKSFRQVWEWHYSTHDFDMDMRSIGTGKIKYQSNNGRFWIYRGTLNVEGHYAMDEHWYTPQDTLGVVSERAQGTDASGMGQYFEFVIDTETGTFNVVATDLVMAGKITSEYGEGPTTRDGYCQVPVPPMHGLPLPSPRPPLQFDEALTIPAPPTWRLADPYDAEMQVSLTIAPVGPKPEFWLKPVSPTWVPEPDKTIPVTVVPKNPNQNPAPVRFILEEVSREPGISLNSPDTNTLPDLEFDPMALDFEPVEPRGDNGYAIQTDEPVRTATINVVAKDYGAWGKVRAEAMIDGAWTPIQVQGSSETFLTLPMDKDGNKIADDWERKAKAGGRAATWDEEVRPPLNGTPGDGLSIYEEYRGMHVKGAHQRLNPLLKELVVENKAGGQAEAGITMLAAATKLKVLILNPGELREDRVANANSVLGRSRAQHGLRLTNVSLAPGTVGQALPVEKTDKRPADCTEVQVDIAQILASPSPIDATAELNSTVAHELAHGVGVGHHGERGAPLIERFLTSGHQPPMHVVYGSDRKVISERPFQIKGTIGGLGSLASGDQQCMMCYNSYYQWSVQRNELGQFRYYAQQYRKPGTRLCNSAKGTGVNAPKNKPAPFFGDAERGNCLGQVCPKDR